MGHVVGFWTWRSLVVDQGLSTAVQAPWPLSSSSRRRHSGLAPYDVAIGH